MRAGTITVVCMLALSGLTGCTHYQPKPLDLATARQTLAGSSLVDVDLQQRLQAMHLLEAGQAVNVLDRAQLLAIATERNPKLLIARAQLQAASAAATTARALPNPTITLGSEYTLSQTAESPWLWSLTTDWLLDVGLRRQLRIQLADVNVRAARLNYAETVWTVRTELRNALLSYLLAGQRGNILMRAVTDQEHLLSLQRQRIAQGEAAAGDALQVELELARSRSAVADNARLQLAALAQLAQSLGVSLQAVQQRSFRWDDLLQVTALDKSRLNTLREAALLSRADLERAVLDYQSRELELQQAVRQQYPQFSIGPGYTWDHGAHKASLGLSFNLPLFNRNQGPITEAEANREVAGNQVLATQALALNEMDAAHTAYNAAVATLQAVLQQSDAAEALLQQTNRALALGSGDQVNVIAARVVVDAQSLSVLDAVERMQQALGQLEDALRTPLSGPELALGNTLQVPPLTGSR